jgi:O-antigen ligase
MPESGQRGVMNGLLGRIGLWFISLILSVAFFCLLLSLFPSVGLNFPIFRITFIAALPVWCLFLPVVIAIRDAEERRGRFILFSGTFIGPVSVVLWCIILQLRGNDSHTVWYGDPLIGVGGISGGIFALIVGFLTTSFYVIGLKRLQRSSGTPTSK